jgi:hypothetical protein
VPNGGAGRGPGAHDQGIGSDGDPMDERHHTMTTAMIPRRRSFGWAAPTFNALLAGAALTVGVVALSTDHSTTKAPAAAVQTHEAHEAEVYTAKSHATPAVVAQPRVLSREQRGESSTAATRAPTDPVIVGGRPVCGWLPNSRC